MKKTVWISFDLGVNGDYEGMYAWLDNHGGKECGDSVAIVEYEYSRDLVDDLKRDLQESVELKKRSRLYVIYRSDDSDTTKGTFLFGKRKQAPWTGYGESTEGSSDESSSSS